MTQRLDGISKLMNCPTKGDDIRRAIAHSRKDPRLTAEVEDGDVEVQAVIGRTVVPATPSGLDSGS